MHGARHFRRHERGTTTLESVGLAVGVALLLAALSTGLVTAGGQPLGERIATRIEQVVGGEPPRPGRIEPAADASAGDAQTVMPVRAAQALRLPSGRTRSAEERRWGGGSERVRVSRDELRMTPLLPPLALWTDRWRIEGRPGGVDTRLDLRACGGCAAAEWSHAFRSGAGVDERGPDAGFEATIRGAARLALASVDATVRTRRELGPVAVMGQARGRATVGADAEGEAQLRLSHASQDLQLTGSAMAGAVARGEAKFGVDVLGIAIRQGARAEGWAGAGARGTVGVTRAPDRVAWRFGWGAAVGLGGAAEWSGSVDISQVPERHRRLARLGLATAFRVSTLNLPLPLPPAP